MKKINCLLFFTVFVSMVCPAQDSARLNLNAVSFEVGKTSLVFNLTYDHRFRNKNFGIRVGGGLNAATFMQIRTFGVGSYYLFGRKSNFFEIGVDASYLYADEISDDQKGFFDMLAYPNFSIKTYHLTTNFGYRRYKNKSLIRVGLSPGFIKKGFVAGGYVSFGLTF